MSRRAIILAGGMGTRLRPYTTVLPKPLMPIGDYPILEVVIRQLVRNGFTRITLAVNHQADLIKAFFGRGEKFNIAIDYSLERQPLGTIGPLKLIEDLPEHFLLMNGDILTDLNYGEFFKQHVESDNLFTISSAVREQHIDYGVLETSESGHLKGFIEKPSKRFEVSMGVYMLSKEILDQVPDARPYGFDKLMLDLLEAKQKVKVVPFDGYWLDIGRPDDYIQAIDQFAEMKGQFLGE